MKNVIPLNPATGRTSRAIRAQYYKNSLRNLELRGGRGCTGIIEIYDCDKQPQAVSGRDTAKSGENSSDH